MTSILSESMVNELKKADKFFERRAYGDALPIYRKILQEVDDPTLKSRYRDCLERLCRRSWKRRHLHPLKEHVVELDEAKVALARLEGASALQMVSVGESADAKFAKWILSADLKSSLLEMRRMKEHSKIAEGWLFLLKREYKRALSAFREAEATDPMRASIGIGVVQLLAGDGASAESSLQPLIPLAPTHFPSLNALLTGDESGNGELLKPHQLFKMEINELKQWEKKLKGKSSPIKPWLALRIADLTYSRSRSEGCKLWKKIEREGATFKKEILKRNFLSAYTNNNIELAVKYFMRLYREIEGKDRKEAAMLVEKVVLDSEYIPLALELDIPNFSWEEDRWEKGEPEPHWALLFLLQTVQMLSERELNPFMSKDDLPSPHHHMKSFPSLDRNYQNNHRYLKLRYECTKYLTRRSTHHTSIYLLVKLDHGASEELIKEMTSIDLDDCEDLDLMLSEVKELLLLQPKNCRLIFREFQLSGDRELCERRCRMVSPSDEALLKFQIALLVDRLPKSKIKELLPPIELLGKESRADAIFFSLLFDGAISCSINKPLLEKYFTVLTSDRERIATFAFQREYGEEKPSGIHEKFCDFYCKRFPEYWESFYLRYMLHRCSPTYPKAIDLLEEAGRRIDSEHPFSARLFSELQMLKIEERCSEEGEGSLFKSLEQLLKREVT